jgi:Uma2 family endonuclease
MARRHAIFAEENNLRIPDDAFAFEGFQRWVDSGDFPETGRIDYLGGDIEVGMSPEDLQTHGLPKGAIYATLHSLVTGKLGDVYTDRARVTNRFAGLSAEPDVVVVFWDSLKAGRVRYVPAASGEPERSSAIDGSPDLVVEVVSDSSERKDYQRLPLQYAKAGIPEMWITDARKAEVRFEIHTLNAGQYVRIEADEDGWVVSPLFGFAFRLIRQRTPTSPWFYVLEHK